MSESSGSGFHRRHLPAQKIKRCITTPTNSSNLRYIRVLHELMPGVSAENIGTSTLVKSTCSLELFVRFGDYGSRGETPLSHENLDLIIPAKSIDLLKEFTAARSASPNKTISEGVTYLQAAELTSRWITTLLAFDDPMEAVKAFHPFLPTPARRSHMKPRTKTYLEVTSSVANAVGGAMMMRGGRLGPLAMDIWEYLLEECKFNIPEAAKQFPFLAPSVSLCGLCDSDQQIRVNAFLCNYLIRNDFDGLLVDQLTGHYSEARWERLVKMEAWEGILHLLQRGADTEEDVQKLRRVDWEVTVVKIEYEKRIPQLIELLKFQSRHFMANITLSDTAFIQVAAVNQAIALAHLRYSSMATVGMFDIGTYRKIATRRDRSFDVNFCIDHLVQMVQLARVKKAADGVSPAPCTPKQDEMFEHVLSITRTKFGTQRMEFGAMLRVLLRLDMYALSIHTVQVPSRSTVFTVNTMMDLFEIAWTHALHSSEFVCAVARVMNIWPDLEKVINSPEMDINMVRLLCELDNGKKIPERARRRIYISDTEPEIARITARLCRSAAHDVSHLEPELRFTTSCSEWNCEKDCRPLMLAIENIASELTQQEFSQVFSTWGEDWIKSVNIFRRNSPPAAMINFMASIALNCFGTEGGMRSVPSLSTLFQMDYFTWWFNEATFISTARALMESSIARVEGAEKYGDQSMRKIVTFAGQEDYGLAMRDMWMKFPAYFARALNTEYDHIFTSFRLTEKVVVAVREYEQRKRIIHV